MTRKHVSKGHETVGIACALRRVTNGATNPDLGQKILSEIFFVHTFTLYVFNREYPFIIGSTITLYCVGADNLEN